MRKSKMSGAELLNCFEALCFRVASYPDSRSANKELCLLEDEMAKRLNVSKEDLEKIRNVKF